jgi:hypothetical protein
LKTLMAFWATVRWFVSTQQLLSPAQPESKETTQ